MIARVWHATATTDGAAAYQRHFTESVVPALRRLPGHRGAYLIQRDSGGTVDLEVMSLWNSLEAIKSFAGDDHTTAVVEPAAQAVLTSYDKHVTHHDVVVNTAAGQRLSLMVRRLDWWKVAGFVFLWTAAILALLAIVEALSTPRYSTDFRIITLPTLIYAVLAGAAFFSGLACFYWSNALEARRQRAAVLQELRTRS